MKQIKTKRYKISEIADLLGVSKEMIRYYEKQNIITPERTEGNNYRTYSSMDFFKLCEMMQQKEWNIGLKKIAEIKMQNHTDSLLECYKESLKDLTNQIHILQGKEKRLKSLIGQTETCRMNIGNYWVESESGGYWFEMMEACGDICGPLKIYDYMGKSIYYAENMVFMDCVFIKNESYSEWGLFLSDEYVTAVTVSVEDAKYRMDERVCFCTIADMGDVGSYHENVLDETIRECEKRGYRRMGKPEGCILARGVENDVYRRYLKIRIPIEKSKMVL